MIYINFSEQVINWFRSYLSNRTFKVKVGKTLSDAGNLNCGVPQGSILGHLLFLLYINDFPIICKHSKCILYADDTGILF